MKKLYYLLLVAVITMLVAADSFAGTASYGFRAAAASWKEKSLFGDDAQDGDGGMFGPSLLFRVGEGDQWAIGLDGLYGSLGDLDRADLDVTVTYELSSFFGVFAAFHSIWYDFEPEDDPSVPESVTTKGLGLGIGASLNVPVADSGLFVFASTRIIPMVMDTDVEDAEGNTLLWAYEGGLAYGVPLDMGVGDSSFYGALGYRFQQLKGEDYDEVMQLPFIEVGFKQEF